MATPFMENVIWVISAVIIYTVIGLSHGAKVREYLWYHGAVWMIGVVAWVIYDSCRDYNKFDFRYYASLTTWVLVILLLIYDNLRDPFLAGTVLIVGVSGAFYIELKPIPFLKEVWVAITVVTYVMEVLDNVPKQILMWVFLHSFLVELADDYYDYEDDKKKGIRTPFMIPLIMKNAWLIFGSFFVVSYLLGGWYVFVHALMGCLHGLGYIPVHPKLVVQVMISIYMPMPAGVSSRLLRESAGPSTPSAADLDGFCSVSSECAEAIEGEYPKFQQRDCGLSTIAAELQTTANSSGAAYDFATNSAISTFIAVSAAVVGAAFVAVTVRYLLNRLNQQKGECRKIAEDPGESVEKELEK
jgi:4-hydroxybenzoate polyprenyltransferase